MPPIIAPARNSWTEPLLANFWSDTLVLNTWYQVLLCLVPVKIMSICFRQDNTPTTDQDYEIRLTCETKRVLVMTIAQAHKFFLNIKSDNADYLGYLPEDMYGQFGQNINLYDTGALLIAMGSIGTTEFHKILIEVRQTSVIPAGQTIDMNVMYQKAIDA